MHTQVSNSIEVNHLSRTIGQGSNKTVILDNISFAIPTQSLFSIVGSSGSGKTTLLNLLTAIDHPTSGQIVFLGQELHILNENALSRWRGRQIGIVFQFFQLIPTLTALENVLLALELGGGGGLARRAWRDRAQHCLEMAEVKGLARRLPSQLSGGEQQRIAIARALANDPPVIVADEPTGNLDSQTAHSVFETLASLRQFGKTVIYVTHNPSLADRATDGIELLDGHLVNRK